VLFSWRDFENTSPISRTEPAFGHDLAGSAGPIFTTGRSFWRLVKFWGATVSITVVLVVALIAISRVAPRASRPDPDFETNDRSRGSRTIRLEVLRLWLPEALIWLAKRQSLSAVIRDHEDLQQFLELQNVEDPCYALTIRAHQASGEFADITFIRHPYDEPHHFLELIDVLATAAGNPPPYTDPFKADFSTAAVQVVPEAPWNRSPRAFIVEQLNHPSPAGDQEQYWRYAKAWLHLEVAGDGDQGDVFASGSEIPGTN
jgi:hypothetical protein